MTQSPLKRLLERHNTRWLNVNSLSTPNMLCGIITHQIVRGTAQCVCQLVLLQLLRKPEIHNLQIALAVQQQAGRAPQNPQIARTKSEECGVLSALHRTHARNMNKNNNRVNALA